MTLEDFDAYAGGRVLKAGYTTGTCAAAAAKAAAEIMFAGTDSGTVSILTPAGAELSIPLAGKDVREDGSVSCTVRKSAGDDPDATDGVQISAALTAESVREGTGEITVSIRGGQGVGTVTKPGLDQPVGSAAINATPRKMIGSAVSGVMRENGFYGTVTVTVSALDGEKIAAKTFNPRLGIVGGISILGTEGIVRPMSRKALVDTIRIDTKMHLQKNPVIAAVPGNYGAAFLNRTFGVPEDVPVIMSNYIGEMIDAACEFHAEGLLLAGHLGKFVKLAGGIMNTHSAEADARLELMCAHTLKCGADAELSRRVLAANTTEEAAAILKAAGLYRPVIASLMQAMERYAAVRAKGRLRLGLIVCTAEDGDYEKSSGADELLGKVLNPDVRETN